VSFEPEFTEFCERFARDARDVDFSGVIPKDHFDDLADLGFYGALAPRDIGGLGLATSEFLAALERLAASCLATTFVFIQHSRLLRTVLDEHSPAFMLEQRNDVVRGVIRGGISLGAMLPGPARLIATAKNGKWCLSGEAPWVSGWGMVTTLLVAARGPDDTVVSFQLDAGDQTGLEVVHQDLSAINATNTVKLRFDNLEFSHQRVISQVPYDPSNESTEGLRMNGSLALGVARRCCSLLENEVLDAELRARRAELDNADHTNIAVARARASAFAVKAANALCVRRGSASVIRGDIAERSVREAALLLTFASRPSIRDELMRRFTNLKV
jgi:alkylation response protein AidB-like acyl-CoA dehydrogenase